MLPTEQISYADIFNSSLPNLQRYAKLLLISSRKAGNEKLDKDLLKINLL